MSFRTPRQLFSCTLILFVFLSANSFAQSHKYEVSGKVVDESGNPLSYATISLKSTDSDFLTGAITTDDGGFSIEVPEDTYNIKVEFISFKPENISKKEVVADVNLGKITLRASAAGLNEVVVTAETTQVEVRLDKKIYNIGKDLTTQGGTVADALNNVPSVSVDLEGAISLRGNENVKILINGKPSAMAGFGNTDVLSQLPSDAIERVEVITSPSARYDAEGTAGILNIILKKDKTLGINGSATLRGGLPDNAGISTNINYRTENFNLFNTTGFRYYNAPGKSSSNTHYFQRGDSIAPYNLIENKETDRLSRSFYTNLGLEYYLTDQSSVTASGFYRNGNNRNRTTNLSSRLEEEELIRKSTRTNLDKRKDESYQVALNYINKFNQEGHQLTADLQYENSNRDQNGFINENVDFNSNPNAVLSFPDELTKTNERKKEYLAKADYVLPFGKGSQFEAGYRGNFSNNVTDYELFIEDKNGDLELDNLSNIFDYTENVNSFYTQYGTKFGNFSFLLGLRLENTQLKGKIQSDLSEAQLQEEFGIPIDTDFNKNYLGLFPTVNLIYELSETENLTLGYNRRINRPRGWYINPFPSRSSRTNIFQGNPNLDPAFSNAFDLGYLKRWDKLTLTTSVYYQHETDGFERIDEATGEVTEGDEILITRTIPVNLSTNDRIGAELGVLYNPVDWLRLNGSFNFYQFNSDGEFNGKDYANKNTSWYSRFSSKVKLPAKIQWQTNAFYMGASESIQGNRDGMFSLNMAFAKDIFNDNATISLNVQDLFNTRKRSSYTLTDFYERDSDFQWRKRSFTLSFTYRFNQQKREQEKRQRQEMNNNSEEEMGEGF